MFFVDGTKDQADFIRKKWDSLKGSYVRRKKRVPSRSTLTHYSEIKFKYFESMSFLDDTDQPRSTMQLGYAFELDMQSPSPITSPTNNNSKSEFFFYYICFVIILL